MSYKEEYLRWCKKADALLYEELKSYSEEEQKEAFYQNLSFGTSGLRGVMGAGTNRMNIHTVAKASQGLANYVNKNFEKNSIAIGYDSRIMSEEFAQTAASVFVANGIKVYLSKEIMPTPVLSYATRELKCATGIMITASHNPAEYNGYKVYGEDGCQITTEIARRVLEEIEKLDIFDDVKTYAFDQACELGLVEYISDDIINAFEEEVKKQSVLFGEEIDKEVSITYTPLNGAGRKSVIKVLNESGYNNITLVKEQEKPDGNFPTCRYPNPENKEAMLLGIDYAKKYNSDLVLATDPDSDRVGIAVKDRDEYRLLSGNEVGILLFNYICEQRSKHNNLPKNPVMIKTIVSSELTEKIAMNYGIRTINVLTGFKFVGEQIAFLEKQDMKDSYVFGFEESCGYLSGTYTRDKDAISAALLICEMFAYYKTKGLSLIEKLDYIYKRYGYCLNSVKSFTFEGLEGVRKMKDIMKNFRDLANDTNANIAGMKVESYLDYADGINGLPKSDVLKFNLEGDCSVIVRPSGTEPKLKIYITACGEDIQNAKIVEENLLIDIKSLIK